MTTFFQLRLLKFIIYSYYGYMFSWNRAMYNDSNFDYDEYEDMIREDVYNYFVDLNNKQCDEVAEVVKWLA